MGNWLKKIEENFGIRFEQGDLQPFGNGHIHQTYKISTDKNTFILQKFNKQVFPYTDRIAHNHQLLLKHRIQETLTYELPLAIPNQTGELFTQVGSDTFRLVPFVSGYSVNEVDGNLLPKMAAKAFAELIGAGKNIDARQFQEVIPDFNNLSKRYQQLEVALENTIRKIEGELAEIVAFYLSQDQLVKEYKYWVARLPLRLTHNDTKINNLIYAEDMGRVKAVIDLDTLMGGFVFYDFGDLVRTVACTHGESSQAWGQISVDNLKYMALKNGFLEAGKNLFTEDELASLEFGGKLMTYMMGLRFLADYLNGNIYYTIHYPEQNFHRAKNQMILLKSLT